MSPARIKQTVSTVQRPDLVTAAPLERSAAVLHPDDRPDRGVELDGSDQSNPGGERATIYQDEWCRHERRPPRLLSVKASRALAAREGEVSTDERELC